MKSASRSPLSPAAVRLFGQLTPDLQISHLAVQRGSVPHPPRWSDLLATDAQRSAYQQFVKRVAENKRNDTIEKRRSMIQRKAIVRAELAATRALALALSLKGER